ncbi:MAG TPA: hypothetical protein VLJ68_01560 [Chitinophagaceae bacterium]|nr:hypothetical protein [Chitinophagaceae bacterium]
MKFILLFSVLLFMAGTSKAQLKTTPVCSPFIVDILRGRVNDVEPDFPPARVKEKLPCFTAEEAVTTPCGGAVYYKDKDIYFFTGREYIEIREKFKGQLSIPLLGAARSSLFRWLGNPKIKDIVWDAFQTQYGTLVLHYSKAGKVNLIQFSKRSTDNLSLCE